MTDSIKETIKEIVNHQAETPTNTKNQSSIKSSGCRFVCSSFYCASSSLVYAWSWFPLSSPKNG